MRGIIIYIFLLFFYAKPTYAAKGSAAQERLLYLAANSANVHPDSIIEWNEQLELPLLQNKQYRDFFEVKYFITNTHARRGDISLAIDEVEEMSKEAERLNYPIGIALASQAIGDTYIYSNMLSEGIVSYKHALSILDKYPNTEALQKSALIQLLKALSSKDKYGEMPHYLTRFNTLLPEEEKGDAFYIFRLLFNTLYAIKQDNLNEAQAHMKEAEQLVYSDNGLYVYPYWCFVATCYYEKKGEYARALHEYEKLSDMLYSGLSPVGYYSILVNNANLLVKMGKADKACQLYQHISHIKDSLSTRSYSRQVNRVQADYRANAIALKNQTQKNKLARSIIVIGIFIILFSIFLTFNIKKGNKKLAESKIRLKEAQKQVENSIRSKSIFLSNMSHEIRTPLNALSGFSAILTEDSIDNDTRLQCVEIIQQNSDLLLKLINDVIDLSNLEFGKMEFTFNNCDAIALCRNMTEMVEQIKQTQARVLFQTTLNELTIYTDDARLQQVLINLLINATKFTPTGTITLELSIIDTNEVLFTITDTGCGIPLEKQESIFNRFEKLDELDQGTGLGLSICQLIIERIGGKIWIDPSYTQGTRFCFTHPIKKMD